MATQNTINQIANRIAVALSHHIKENETLDLAQTHYLEEEVVDTLYEEMSALGFIPKNSCDEPLFGTRVDSEQDEIYRLNAEVEALKRRISELEHREGLGGGD